MPRTATDRDTRRANSEELSRLQLYTLALTRLMVCIGLTAACVARAAHAAQSTDLTSLSLEQLLEISVVGASKYEQRQTEVAAAVSIITRQEIKAFGWRTLDEALTSLPGMDMTYDRQYTYLGTRGFGLPGDYNTRLLVTINGNRVNDPAFDAGPGGRQFPLDVDLIERIEFIPGPGGAVYGQNAMFGVVNVVTRNGGGIGGGELAASYQGPQSLREGRATWGWRLDNGVDAALSVSGMYSRGEDRFFDFGKSGISGVAAGLDGERDSQLFAHLARGPWSFDFVHGDRRKDDPTGAFLSDPLVAGQYQADRYELAHLQYQDALADGTMNVLGRVFLGTENYTSILHYRTPFSYPATSQWRGAELRLLTSARAAHKAMVGLEVQANVHQDQAAIDLANPAASIFIPTSGYRVGVYAQDEWQISQALMATLGLRADRNDITGAHTSPRAGLIWQASPATTLKALYGRAHRAPNVGEQDYYDGVSQVANPGLGGETIDTFEVVADHRVNRNLSLRSSLYFWKMRNLITLGIDSVSGLSQYQSGEPVKARGLELSADRVWESGARMRGSVSVQDAAYSSGQALLNSPSLLGKLNLSVPLPWAGVLAGYEWRYDGARLSGDGSELGGYAQSNLNLSSAALAQGLKLSLGIHNLFGKRYAHPGADINWQNSFEQDGRSVRLRLDYRI
jgi:outer membrane receptor protein involved in Fe transport